LDKEGQEGKMKRAKDDQDFKIHEDQERKIKDNQECKIKENQECKIIDNQECKIKDNLDNLHQMYLFHQKIRIKLIKLKLRINKKKIKNLIKTFLHKRGN